MSPLFNVFKRSLNKNYKYRRLLQYISYLLKYTSYLYAQQISLRGCTRMALLCMRPGAIGQRNFEWINGPCHPNTLRDCFHQVIKYTSRALKPSQSNANNFGLARVNNSIIFCTGSTSCQLVRQLFRRSTGACTTTQAATL